MFSQVGRIVAIGGVLGIGAALVLGRFAESQLFEVSGFDFRVMAAAAAGIVLVALTETMIHAWSAARVDPMVALRHE